MLESIFFALHLLGNSAKQKLLLFHRIDIAGVDYIEADENVLRQNSSL